MLDPNGTLRVLVVDDDAFTLELVRRVLLEQGYEVLCAANGKEALDILREAGPSVVITDWIMPEMDGLQLCREIRSSEEYGFTYVMLLTSNTQKEHLVTAFEAGVDDYIRKPFDEGELLARLKAAERITRLEAFYRHHVVQLHKVNAQVAVMNSKLDRAGRSLAQARDEAERAVEAAAASAAKSEFLADMSHEIRTPVAAIVGFAETLATEGELSKAPAHRLDAVDTIRRNGEHLLGLIGDILDLSKVEAGKLEVEHIRCSPAELANDVYVLMTQRAKAQGLKFDLTYAGALPETIETDPTRLRQILVNLVGNAIKFTEQGHVELAVSLTKDAAGPRLQFEIADTGIGLTRAQIARLFKPFSQAEASTTRKFGGTGLGLAISKRLAAMLGGDITLVETQPGVGTCFRLTVGTGSLDGVTMVDDPRSVTSATSVAECEARPGAVGEQPVLQGRRVLLVDDGQDNQRLIQFILTKAGAEVTIAENGQAALKVVSVAEESSQPFDLILMDMQMPVMDGYEATRHLRTRGYKEPILALTANAMAGDRAKCLSAGCNEYVSKPIKRDVLVALIAAHLPQPVTVST